MRASADSSAADSHHAPGRWLWVVLSVLVLLGTVLSLSVGYIGVRFDHLLTGALVDGNTVLQRILFEIRLPRTVLAVLVGGTLGLAGAAMQGLLRNPLAEPGLLGASSGAALGAVCALYSGFADTFWLALPLAGFTGTALAVFTVAALAGRSTGTTALILSGVAISALCGALISLVLNLSPSAYAAFEIVFWLLGSLTDRSNNDVLLVIGPMLLGAALLLSTMSGLRALSLGEETAHALGVNLASVKTRVVLGTALAIGAGVSVTGSISFIGLIAPHVMRPFVKADPGRLLPASMLAGAILLLAADIGVRLLVTRGPEIKLGVLTALIGAPFFLLLIVKTRRTMP